MYGYLEDSGEWHCRWCCLPGFWECCGVTTTSWGLLLAQGSVRNHRTVCACIGTGCRQWSRIAIFFDIQTHSSVSEV